MAHNCHAIGCNIETRPALLMCLNHWRLVPDFCKRQINKTYRRGQEIDKRPSKEYLQAAKRAVIAVAQIEGKPTDPLDPKLRMYDVPYNGLSFPVEESYDYREALRGVIERTAAYFVQFIPDKRYNFNLEDAEALQTDAQLSERMREYARGLIDEAEVARAAKTYVAARRVDKDLPFDAPPAPEPQGERRETTQERVRRRATEHEIKIRKDADALKFSGED